jgi:ribosomal protein L2
MAGTRSYTIEIKDIETGQTVVLMAADWDENDKRVAVAQVMRLAGVPDGSCFLDEVAPKQEPRKS